MRGLSGVGGVAALVATLSLPGCASMGGYDLAPNGLTRDEAALRQGLADKPASTHEAVVEGERPLPDDDLLRLLYASSTGRHAGHYRESSQYLDIASYLADDRVTTSVSRQALSFITSDRALEYVPSRTERLMIHYVAALNYLEAGDPGGAVVEARRIEALLDQYDEGTPRNEIPADSRFLHYFAATVFDAAGERSSADVAYRRAGLAIAPTPPAYEGVPEDSLGEVVVVVERGFVPHRVEQSVVVALPPYQVALLTEGSPGEKAAAAVEAAGRILLYAASLYGDRGPLYRDHSYRRTLHLSPWQEECRGARKARCGANGEFDPYLLRISWPVLYQEPVPGGALRVETEGGVAAQADRRLDVSAGIRRDFADQRPTMLARTVFRAATKLALSESAEAAVSERDEGAGRLVGLLINLGTLLTERADTRSWHLLPGTVDLVRLRLPAGTHALAIDTSGWLGRDVELGTVEVRAGRTAFVSHRIWR